MGSRTRRRAHTQQPVRIAPPGREERAPRAVNRRHGLAPRRVVSSEIVHRDPEHVAQLLLGLGHRPELGGLAQQEQEPGKRTHSYDQTGSL
ncbi:uncharacterized protein FIBRA_05186 [Fibroporia radiculosa]|uniref:Uncharacterized protein n=1 Tax=Fibroporia radiculosa TaxID=599839 RepID=J4IAK4_9APHY|nr:uncharacterized protein FIBRA_05186 [Fibroporia radiculosa]CCM03066.1 predicted protein [Fibroporia radiculosa]